METKFDIKIIWNHIEGWNLQQFQLGKLLKINK